MEDDAVKSEPPPPPEAGDQVVVAVMEDRTVQCSEHRLKNTNANNSGGICAFCLQEKLGKLVSSSFPPQKPTVIPSSSSSPSPSFRSDANGAYGGFGNSSAASSSSSRVESQFGGGGRMVPFVSPALKKKNGPCGSSSSSFKRSNSITCGPLFGAHQVEDSSSPSPRSKRPGFWSSIFYLSSSSSKPADSAKNDRSPRGATKTKDPLSMEEEEDEPMSQRKVSRSRSLGCGSRSFSGDFFGKISNGFGDCTLRRVESQREEGKKPSRLQRKQKGGSHRVKCGGIFSGFMLATTSSSSSSSSSSYWVCDEIGRRGTNGNNSCGRPGSGANGRTRGSSSSWGWGFGFATPKRAFSRPSSKAGGKVSRGREASHSSRKNAASSTTARGLNSIPSILAVSG